MPILPNALHSPLYLLYYNATTYLLVNKNDGLCFNSPKVAVVLTDWLSGQLEQNNQIHC